MSAALYRYRATFRRQWRAYLSAAVLLGVLGGITLGALAGARRTGSAVHRFLASTNPSDVSLDSGNYDAALARRVGDLPQVVAESTYVAFNAAALDEQGGLGAEFEGVGSLDGRFFDQDRFAIVEGRRPRTDQAGEVAVNEVAAEFYGITVGDQLPLVFATEEQLEDPDLLDHFEPAATLDAEVVGIGLFNDEIVQDEADQLPRLLLTPAFTAPNVDISTFAWQGVQVRDPQRDVAAVVAEYAEMAPFVVTRVAADDEAAAQRAVRPLAVALGAFGGVAALVTVLLVGQALGRLVAAERSDGERLRALGAVPASRFAAIALTVAGPVVGGGLVAVAVAVSLSPLAPIGPTARVEPAPGLQFDGLVHGLGGLALVALLLGVGAVIGWVELRRSAAGIAVTERRSVTTDVAARAGLPAPAVTGLRMALEPGRAGAAVPVRAAAFGAVVAVMAVVTALTFRSSLDTLLSSPELYGWSWDLTVMDDGGYGQFDLDAVGAALDGDPDVQRWGGMYFAETTVDGESTGVLGVDPREQLAPPILRGDALAGPGEVVLGAGLLERLDKGVGDTVEVETAAGLQPIRVVGTAALPALGPIHGAHPSLGDGVVMIDNDLPAGGPAEGAIGPTAILVRLRPGADPGAADRIGASLTDLGSYPGSAQATAVQRPAELVEGERLGRTPAWLAGGLMVAALASLGLTVAASVRRRRHQLGLLKALGFTRRQLAAAIAWQASTTVVIGLVIGIPLGLAAGRVLWGWFADELHVVDRVTVPVLLVAASAFAMLVLANVLAALPARAASRTHAAVVFRDE